MTLPTASIKVGGKTYTLVETCGACPEQYDVYAGTKIDNVPTVGYLRLRHGIFEASWPECGGEVVYCAEPEGDGMLEDDERPGYILAALKAIHRRRSAPP